MSDEKKVDGKDVMAAVGLGTTATAIPLAVGAVLALPVAVPAAIAGGVTLGVISLIKAFAKK